MKKHAKLVALGAMTLLLAPFFATVEADTDRWRENRKKLNRTSTESGGGGGGDPVHHVARDVPGPDFTGIGNNAEDFTPEHHVFVVENTRSTTDDQDGTSLNTGGIAIILHNDGNDDFSVFDLDSYNPNDHVLNTVNRNDHFLTFFRESADGTQDIVGRVEGLSFWDLGEVNQNLVDFFADTGHLPWNWFDLNVTFNPPSSWLQIDWPTLSHSGTDPTFNGGSLPWLRFNNLNCEHTGGTEVCIDLGTFGPEIDLTFNPGSTPNIGWGYLDDPFMGLSLSGGSIDGTPPIEFGSPFLQTDTAAVNQFATDLEDLFGQNAPVAVEMVTDPVGFAAKYFFALRGGVTYESGSGDYAEWLERLDPDEELEAGEIVGVYGGKVSRNTEGADHAMVVSYKPIVLGNMPTEDRADLFDKIAFMGQTLVKVVGTVEKGDYILPSGKNDGYGIAVSPSDIRAEQLASVVGIAWGAGGTEGRLGLVNVAVGLRPVEVTRVIAEQQASLDAARDEIAQLKSELTTMQASIQRLDNLSRQLETLQAVQLAERR